MSRCKACDTILTEGELGRMDRYSGLHLDLCGECRRISDDALEGNWSETEGEIVIISDKEVDIH